MNRLAFIFIIFVYNGQLIAEVIVGNDFLENARKLPSVAFVCGKPAMVWNITTSKWERDDTRDCLIDPVKIVDYCNKKFVGQGFGQFKSVMPWPHELLIEDWCDFFEPTCKSPKRVSRAPTTPPRPTTPSLAVRNLDEDTEYVYDDEDDYDSTEQLDPLALALQTSFSVRPYRCLDSPQQSDTLVVPQGRGCDFLHFESPGVMEALQSKAANAPAIAARRARRQASAASPTAATANAPARPAGCLDYWAWNLTASRLCAATAAPARSRTLYSFVPILPCDAGTFGGVQYVCCANAANNGAAGGAGAPTNSNRRASASASASAGAVGSQAQAQSQSQEGGDSEVLGLLMQGEWPLPQPRPDDALRRLLDDDEMGITGAPTPMPTKTTARPSGNNAANASDADDNKNYYVEYMLRPGALGASETVRFRNAANLVRRQHDRLADKYKAEYNQLVQRISRENSADANARLQQARKDHEELLKLNDETERNMLELMRQVHRQRIHQEDRQQRSNALAELHGELNLLEMLDDEREALKELPFVVRALLHYLRAEEKERIHRINMYEFDEDRDQKTASNERSSLRLSLLEIATRINQTLLLVDKLPPRLQQHIANAIEQFLEGYEDVDDEIRVLFPSGLRRSAVTASSADTKTKAPFRPKSPPALEGTATPPVTGAGARSRPAAAGADDPRVNMMPESDYDYDRESGELEIENIEREVEEHVAHVPAAAAVVTGRPAQATSQPAGEYDYQLESESDESSTRSNTPLGPHKANKAEQAVVGGSLLQPVPQPVDSLLLLPDGDEPIAMHVATSSVADAVGAAVRAHAILALLVALLGVALLVAIATLCCSLLRARRNRMRYRQLQMPTVTTLVESEKEKLKQKERADDSASLESASLAEAELQLVNQMQIKGFENPTYKLFENK